ncbi:CACTA en-spm transposon protein [Cucumis melo var. makuwa]|uniref:CACTA en-spm transposon protein n=1 Tax=Cucumis melo var. makuwa TaxID=1194695 RepID=A0A5A7UN26_CUCMM|nr:CACTA en-spm transposon protein [Cucumis melo var. makuwa]
MRAFPMPSTPSQKKHRENTLSRRITKASPSIHRENGDFPMQSRDLPPLFCRRPSPPSATLGLLFKEFWANGHRHFKKYSNLELACANPPNALVGRDEDRHFLCDHYISRAFQEQSRTNKAARQKQPYNHSSGSKSFLQRQYELVERKGKSVDHVELFRETHVRAGTFVSQAAEDTHRVASHSLRMRYAIRCWVDDQATQKALVGIQAEGPQNGECKQFVDILFAVHRKRD